MALGLLRVVRGMRLWNSGISLIYLPVLILMFLAALAVDNLAVGVEAGTRKAVFFGMVVPRRNVI